MTGNLDNIKQLNKMEESSPSRDHFDRRILFAIRKIIRAVDVDSKKLSSKHNITGPQLVTLSEIVDAGTITSTEISKRVHLSTSTIVGILDRLERRGLITRRRAKSDRRMVKIEPTSKGKDFFETMPNPLLYTLHNIVNKLPDGEQEQLAESLEKVINLMDV